MVEDETYYTPMGDADLAHDLKERQPGEPNPDLQRGKIDVH
jgi:hypothetical protein